MEIHLTFSKDDRDVMILKTCNHGYDSVSMRLEIDWDQKTVYFDVTLYANGKVRNERTDSLAKAIDLYDEWKNEI